MSWPAPDEYSEAVQNPGTAFLDEDLRASAPACNNLGLPVVATGAFASVYRLRSNCGDFAVRCFLRENPEREERYRKISEFIQADHLVETVGFGYLQQGIQVSGKWLPILKMDWVEGRMLTGYLEEILAYPEQIHCLAERFKSMVLALQEQGVAHGDLQHGNILVCNGDLRLVDYDGMFVPALAGQLSHELGHPNYQHPDRTAEDFGPYLDNFSSWLIYLTLLILRADPGLWSRFCGGDERLLFTRKDLQQPESSALVAELLMHRDSEIRAHAETILQMLQLSPSKIPPLDARVRSTSRHRLRVFLYGLEHHAARSWTKFSRQLQHFSGAILKQSAAASRTQAPTEAIKGSAATVQERSIALEKFRRTVPGPKEWHGLKPAEKVQLVQIIEDAVIMEMLRKPNDSRLAVAVNIAAVKVAKSEDQARVFIPAMIHALKRNPKCTNVLVERLGSAFITSRKYCSPVLPQWISKDYFDALDVLLSLTSRDADVTLVDLSAFMSVWLRLPGSDNVVLEDFLLARSCDAALSEELRIRCIYAARQLLDLYRIRCVDNEQVLRFVSKIRSAKSRATGKACSFFLSSAINEKWSNV